MSGKFVTIPIPVIKDHRLSDEERRVLISAFWARDDAGNLKRTDVHEIVTLTGIDYARVNSILEQLANIGWIGSSGKPTVPRHLNSQSPVARAVTRRKRVEYSPEFEEAWAKYPKRAGANPKVPAYRAWCARMKEGVDEAHMLDGVSRYERFCRETGKEGTEYVMQAQRFFGPQHPYRESWAIPVQRTSSADKVSAKLDAMFEQAVKKHGHTETF